VHHAADLNLQVVGHDVGVVLRAGGGRVDLVVAAIRDDNPDADLHVIDHGDVVEVWAYRRLQLTGRSLRWHIDWDLGTHDLWSMIVSFHGTVTATGDCVTVTSGGVAHT
jgi:MmoB/DmpM family protein